MATNSIELVTKKTEERGKKIFIMTLSMFMVKQLTLSPYLYKQTYIYVRKKNNQHCLPCSMEKIDLKNIVNLDLELFYLGDLDLVGESFWLINNPMSTFDSDLLIRNQKEYLNCRFKSLGIFVPIELAFEYCIDPFYQVILQEISKKYNQ